jgi:hypothetical protein
LKVETPYQADIASTSQVSPTDSITPRTSASGESSITASSFGTITSSFQAVNFSSSSGAASSHKRSASQAQLPGAELYPSSSATAPSGPPANYDQMTSSFSVAPTTTDLTDQDSYVSGSSVFGEVYSEAGHGPFTTYTTSHFLPHLRIPEEPYVPGLSYTQDNSPWCSSASDSTYSTPSDGSRNGRLWPYRGRSASIATLPDWSAPTIQWSPHAASTAAQDLRSPAAFETIPEQYETAPYMSPRITSPISSHQLLDVPNAFGGYHMESVGTPALSTYRKPLAQLFSASNSRVSDSGLASIDRRPKELVECQQLGTLTIGTAMRFHQAQLDTYLSTYWRLFDPLIPIIHRGTFDSYEDNLLSSAMAAIGTQFHDDAQARQQGVELHDFCKKSIDLVSSSRAHSRY